MQHGLIGKYIQKLQICINTIKQNDENNSKQKKGIEIVETMIYNNKQERK